MVYKGVVTVLKYSTPLSVKAFAISSVVAKHATGCPLPIGLPMVTISGQKSSPCCSKPQKWLPKRPKPVCTSSATKMPPAERTYLYDKGQIHFILVWTITGNTRNAHHHSLCNFGRVPWRQDDLPSDTRQWFSEEGRDLWESIINNVNVGHLIISFSSSRWKSEPFVPFCAPLQSSLWLYLHTLGLGLDDPLCTGLCRCLAAGPERTKNLLSDRFKTPLMIRQDVNINLFFTHHMNPLFLSCQFSKFVRTDVDERLEVPMVSTSIEKQSIVIVKVMSEVWCVGLQQDAYWSSTMTSSFSVYCWAKRRARSLASDLSAGQTAVWNQRFQQRLGRVWINTYPELTK